MSQSSTAVFGCHGLGGRVNLNKELTIRRPQQQYSKSKYKWKIILHIAFVRAANASKIQNKSNDT